MYSPEARGVEEEQLGVDVAQPDRGRREGLSAAQADAEQVGVIAVGYLAVDRRQLGLGQVLGGGGYVARVTLLVGSQGIRRKGQCDQ